MAITFKQPKPALVTERFEIESRLGAGGFGVVYRAFDRERGTHVALKTLHETSARNLYRFKREFRALADIAHPNLVTLYELISEGDLWYFTMELVDGVDFLEWVTARQTPDSSHTRSQRQTVSAAAATVEIDGQLLADTSEHSTPPMQTGELATDDIPGARRHIDMNRLKAALAQLTRGVMALHAYGKLHRDIKPSNVLVTPSGRVVLLDFGMVIDVDPRTSPLEKLERQSKPNRIQFGGTPQYMAPEQARGDALGRAADWYAMGVMLYEALTGQPPIDGQTQLALLLRKQSVDPTPVDELADGIPDELAELCMQMLARPPEARPDGDEILERLTARDRDDQTRSSWMSGRFERTHFVGRDAQIRLLHRGLRRCIHGDRLTVANVRGESGMGKTTLVERFLDSLYKEPYQPLILEGRCYENESVPYKALDSLIDDLSGHLDDLSKEDVAACVADDIGALVQLFPVLRRARAIQEIVEQDAGLLDLDSERVRQRAFSALRKLLYRLAEHHPLVLFIDDVQWGDEDSARLLSELLGPPDPPPLFLVTTWRSEDVDSSPFLRAYLPLQERLGDDAALIDVELGELGADEALELASTLLDRRSLDDELRVEAIAREAHGNPFFIDELARHVRAFDTGPDSDITSLGDVIYRRVEQLEAPARRLLEVLAVAGQPLERSVARQVAELGADEQPSLAALRGELLIRVQTSYDSDRLEPYHARIGETLRERLDASQLRSYHLALAETLETATHFEPAAVAQHYLAAGVHQKAGHYALVAADRAYEGLAFERAARFYEQALELREWPKTRAELWTKLGQTFGYLGRGSRAAAAYDEAAALTDGPSAHDLRIRAAEQLLRSGRFDEGIGAIEALLRSTGFDPPSSTLGMIASILWKRLRLKGRDLDVDVQPASQLPREARARLEALWTPAKMLGIIDPLQSAYFNYHALDEALRHGSASHLALTICQQAAQEAAPRPTPEYADELLARAEALSAHADDAEYVRGYIDFVRGFNAYTDGQWAEARALIRQARQRLLRECDGVVWEADTFHFLEFFPTYWLGAFDDFAADIPRLLERAVDRNDTLHAVGFRCWVYPAYLAADEPHRARNELETALADWSRKGYHMQHFWYLQGTVETALYEGDGLHAVSVFNEHRGPLRRSMLLQNQIIRIIVTFLGARSALAGARRTRSGWKRWWLRHRVRKAMAKLEGEAESPWASALAKLLHGEVLCADELPERAARAFEEAAAALDAADMPMHAAAARRRQGQLLGGRRGEALLERADALMAERGVVDPAAMTAMLTGGPRRQQPARLAPG